jgi:cell wall-associated NlpC family hydrolase
MPHRTRLIVAGAMAALVTMSAVIPASADPITDKQRQAQQIADEIERLGDAAADLGEQYNGALVQLQQADVDVKDAEAKLADLEAKLGSVRTAAGAFALKAYVYADQTSGVAAMLSGTDLSDGSAQREGYNEVALGKTSDVTDGMKALIEDADRQKADLDAKRAQQANLADVTKKRQQAAEAAQAKQQQALVKVKGELNTLVVQEQQRRAAESARQAAAAKQQAQAALLASQQRAAAASSARPTAATGTQGRTVTASDTGDQGDTSGGSTDNSASASPPQIDIPTTSPGAATAVRAALSQLGVPYRFAAASPGQAFDCSGLTMWAWGQAGVSLPHFAASQYAMLPHVPLDQLQPGDLVFFYSDVHHVGIYIGNGMMVHAPRTGDVVKVSPLQGRNLIGAARP